MILRANDLLRNMFGRGKFSAQETSLKMNRSRNYLSACISDGRVPSLELTAEIMDAIDYDVVIRDRYSGYEIIIAPPE